MKPKFTPPVATRNPHPLVTHEDKRIDDYYWLRQQEDSQVIDYLEAENSYTKQEMQHTEQLQQSLYDEMLSRIKETDLSVPYRLKDYYYYSRTEEGKAYSIFCRKYQSLDAEEEILLDENKLAEGEKFFSLGLLSISPNQQILAYSVDTTGAEQYTLYFLDLTTRKLYPEAIADTYYSFAWGNDDRTTFYTKIDSANRPYQLWRHSLASDPMDDVLVYQEDDESYFLSVSKTRSRSYILLNLGSMVTSEVRYLNADCPTDQFKLFQPRQQGIEYSLEHHSDRFYIVTNEKAINFKLMATKIDSPDKTNWETIIPHREDVLLEGVDAFAEHLVIYERQQGLPTAKIEILATGETKQLHFPEPTYSFSGGNNPEFDTSKFRYGYSSMITPSSVFDLDLLTEETELLKETEVLGGYDRSLYASQRLMATALDGTQVPISLVYKQGVERDGSNPLWLKGYGSYGYAYPATFSSIRLSLLDRGYVVAIAHIRGGEEMGRKWYEDGKFLNKKNTFTDFIACAEHLITQKWTNSDRLVISGGSAGGLLMGAVVNLRPDLFKAVVANVPFVDVLTTILDESLPLTVIEWEEWGNPHQPEYYDYIKSYSPYDNVEAKDYPNLLITAGLNDPRVKYWEPAKWTAKLRQLKTDNNILLLKTNMSAGHGGASGRYEYLKEIALEYAFVLEQLNNG
ncbi:MAG: S9 family peptidase [Pleurocapsa sp. MO_226.B13]|nr:S9 family peptidase [Pleurocapsa sp. MO_226.B13]